MKSKKELQLAITLLKRELAFTNREKATVVLQFKRQQQELIHVLNGQKVTKVKKETTPSIELLKSAVQAPFEPRLCTDSLIEEAMELEEVRNKLWDAHNSNLAVSWITVCKAIKLVQSYRDEIKLRSIRDNFSISDIGYPNYHETH